MKFSLALLTTVAAALVVAAPTQAPVEEAEVPTNETGLAIPDSAVSAIVPLDGELAPVFVELDDIPVLMIVNTTAVEEAYQAEEEAYEAEEGSSDVEKRDAAKFKFRLTRYGWFSPNKREEIDTEDIIDAEKRDDAKFKFRLTRYEEETVDAEKRDAAKFKFRLTRYGWFSPNKREVAEENDIVEKRDAAKFKFRLTRYGWFSPN
ncbi:hypothetical protein K6H10_000668 [Candida tropicalis]